MVYLLLILGLLPSGICSMVAPMKASLKVEVRNVRTQKGAVYIALFKAGTDFPGGKPVEGKKVNANGTITQTMFSVDPGNYAIAVYHDENGNGQMDKRIFGIPKEPYGFSNNFRPLMSAPKFSDCQFNVGDGGKAVSIELR